MKVKIKLDEYLSKEEIKEIASTEIRTAIRAHFSGSDSNLERVVTNLCYSFVWKMIDEQLDNSLEEKLKDSITGILDGMSEYLLFRKRNAWEKEDSKAYKILQDEVEKNKHIIAARVKELFGEYDFSEITQETISDAISTHVAEQLFRKGGSSE